MSESFFARAKVFLPRSGRKERGKGRDLKHKNRHVTSFLCDKEKNSPPPASIPSPLSHMGPDFIPDLP